VTDFCTVCVRDPIRLYARKISSLARTFRRYEGVPKFKSRSRDPSLWRDQDPHLAQCNIGYRSVDCKQHLDPVKASSAT